MRAFADLLDRLIYTRSRNAKLRLIGDYLRTTPDPDRGWAIAALTGESSRDGEALIVQPSGEALHVLGRIRF